MADAQKAHKPTRKQLDAAVAVIEELACVWDPSRYEDRYRVRLKKIVARKRKGKPIKAPKTLEQPTAAPDLMDALERTLEELKQGGSGRWTDTRTRERAT